MAITADTVYSGSQMTQYNPLPMGFYHNVAAADNSATTIVDDKMSTTKDTICTIAASTYCIFCSAHFVIYNSCC